MTKENWQTIGKSGLLGLVFLVLTRLLSEVAFLLAQSMRAFDPNGSFLYISIHHLWQGLLALLAILLLGPDVPHSAHGLWLQPERMALFRLRGLAVQPVLFFSFRAVSVL